MKGKHKVIIEAERLKYEFEIRRNITVIQGDSATGKTTLVDLIRTYGMYGEESGIMMNSDVPCVAFSGDTALWKAAIETYHDSIVFFDEESSFIFSREFAEKIRVSSNYYVLITRQPLHCLPYSINEIYGIRTTGKYHFPDKIYHEFYPLYEAHLSGSTSEIVLHVEDAEAGYQFFRHICGDMRRRMVYYLKLNRIQPYTFRNLQHWADMIAEDKAGQIYVLCDQEELSTQVAERVDFHGIPVAYIRSEREDPQLGEIVRAVISEGWSKAAYAHLTTFLHAAAIGADAFWNIDADDTLFCLPAGRASQILREAEIQAEQRGIDIFSLDMWHTRTMNHWSFGVTYTRNTFDWIKRIRDLIRTDERYRSPLRPPNVDGFFSRMRKYGAQRIESFYVDHMAFVHYCDDFVYHPWVGGLYEWRDGKYRMPVIGALYGIPEIGEMPVNDEVIRLEVSVSDEERREFLLSYCDPYDAGELTGKLAWMRMNGLKEYYLPAGLSMPNPRAADPESDGIPVCCVSQG